LAIWLCVGCGTEPPAPLSIIGCSSKSPEIASPSSNSLAHYDAAVADLLDEATQHPTTNDGGQVVWNARYYMESLLTAYEGTGNAKYINSLIDTGNAVLGLAQTLQVPDVSDPSALGPSEIASAPQRTITGWPTTLGTLGQLVSIPTTNGKTAFYAQTLWPSPGSGAGFLQVSSSPSGGLVITFELDGSVWQSYTVQSQSDVDALVSQPMIWGSTLGRVLAPTGLGLPAPGLYPLDSPIQAVWHSEQTAGILLPFVRFLLLAKQRPAVADQGTVQTWTSKVLAIANSYEDEMLTDGAGGLVLTTAYWMPSPYAGLPVDTDYINAEISLRMLLGVLTSDAHQFSLAQGLLMHEMTNLPLSSQGWLLIRDWPDVPSWSEASNAPKGSIWTSLSTAYAKTPESSEEGGFFVETLQIATDNEVGKEVGLTEELCQAEAKTFQEYLRLPLSGSEPLVRAAYPTTTSKASDPPDYSDDAVDAARYAQPITENQSFVCDNWNWMLNNGMTREAGVGHVLLDWARSEVAWQQLIPTQCP